ncbi:hypothetical protein B0H10DRAFT_1959006 [Mycena sp. CBHHK59/15]|nr:hypothetical protein B0H10DRAFT_1959006 [Mycena sp. CBHHK59/15]
MTLPTAYLSLVSNWVEEILLNPSSAQACDRIRGCGTIFHGVGVYTVMELFFMAGLSPCLTLSEVFSNPSRTARFLIAIYSYIARSENDLWDTLLRPCIHDGILAPTSEQCLRYADWLFIWAKDCTSIPHRMASLVNEHHTKIDALSELKVVWRRESVSDLFDVFEPTFLTLGLRSEINLGHLIFGEDVWITMGGQYSPTDDPLTALYQKYGLLSSPTMLKPGFYFPLFLPHCDFRGKTSSHCPTFTFHDPKEMWSITRNFPSNSQWSSDSKARKKKQDQSCPTIVGRERDAMLFKNILTSSIGVSIGPLEYCGVGHIVHVGWVAYVAACKGDPEIPEFHKMRILRGLDRISSHLDTVGKRKRSRSDKENKSLAKKLSRIEAGVFSSSGSSFKSPEPCTSPSKLIEPTTGRRLGLSGMVG